MGVGQSLLQPQNSVHWNRLFECEAPDHEFHRRVICIYHKPPYFSQAIIGIHVTENHQTRA